MPFTKQNIVESALEEIGVAPYQYNLVAEQLQSGVYRLDALVRTWESKGHFVSYPLTRERLNSSLDDEVNLPAASVEALTLQLASRLAGQYGKQLMPSTAANLTKAMNALDARTTEPMQFVPNRYSTPRGAGLARRNASGERPFFSQIKPLIGIQNTKILGFRL